MKNILIATNVLLLGVSLFLGYKLFKPKADQTGINTNTIESGKPCAAKFCKDYSNVPWEGRINGYLAKKLADQYRADIGKNFIWNGAVNSLIADSRSAWFPLETLKRYIWQIETMNCKNKCTDSLGIRIYYGRYPDSADKVWNDYGMEAMIRYAKHHTLFMVPTYWNKDSGAHIDFDPWSGCHGRIDTLPTALGLYLLLAGGNGSNDSQNHGSLIPPDDPSGITF